MGMPRVPKGLKSSMPGIKQHIKSEWDLGVLQSLNLSIVESLNCL